MIPKKIRTNVHGGPNQIAARAMSWRVNIEPITIRSIEIVVLKLFILAIKRLIHPDGQNSIQCIFDKLPSSFLWLGWQRKVGKMSVNKVRNRV